MFENSEPHILSDFMLHILTGKPAGEFFYPPEKVGPFLLKNMKPSNPQSSSMINELIEGFSGSPGLANISKSQSALLSQLLKRERTKSLYRGVQKEKFGYPSLEEAGVTEEQLMKPDQELGKGYWFSEDLPHAEKYGNEIQKVKGKFKIYDLENGTDKEINNIYDVIRNRRLSGEILKFPKPKGYIQTNKLIDALHSLAKSKGYEGFKRLGYTGKDAGYNEIMFFNKPK